MATRRNVREAFYGELESAASSHLAASDIGQEYPNSGEDLPAIVHNDNYRDAQARWNARGAPVEVVDNGDGTFDVKYVSMKQAMFQVLIISDDEQEKEDIYEDVSAYFEKFDYPRWDASSIQTDVHDVSVEGPDSQDTQNRDPPARGDLLTITLGYKKFISYTVEDISKVTAEFDVDGDDIAEITRTTN